MGKEKGIANKNEKVWNKEFKLSRWFREVPERKSKELGSGELNQKRRNIKQRGL